MSKPSFYADIWTHSELPIANNEKWDDLPSREQKIACGLAGAGGGEGIPLK
jgi:hypothetical protein